MSIKVIDISSVPYLVETKVNGKHQHNFKPSYLGYTTVICQVGDCLESYKA